MEEIVIQRVLCLFQKDGEDLLHEIDISNLEIDFLKQWFNPIDDDPLLYGPYQVNFEFYKELCKTIIECRNYNWEDYDWYMECYTL
jgi:hypothetical protein